MKTKKPLSKINQTIVDLYNRVEEIMDYDAWGDFHTREGKIVACIKAYQWLDEDDVEKCIKDRHLSDETEHEIRDEFDSDRLSNIYWHCCELFVTSYKDELEGRVHLDDLNMQAAAYRHFFNHCEDDGKWPEGNQFYQFPERLAFYQKHYLESYQKFYKRKKNTPENYLAYIRKQNKWNYEETKRLDLINPEVWQYGRSGGWLSVCSTDTLNNWRYYDYSYDAVDLYGVDLSDNDELNNALREQEYTSKNKHKLIHDMKAFIREWEATFAAVNHYVDAIEASVETFKDDYLIQELIHEIDEFLAFNTTGPNCSIQVEGDNIRTTLGVVVPVDEFKKAFKTFMQLLHEHEINEKFDFITTVGNYTTEYAIKGEDDTIIKAGCHKFSFNQVKKALVA